MAQYRWLAFTTDGDVVGCTTEEQADLEVENDSIVVDTVSGVDYPDGLPIKQSELTAEDDEDGE